MSASNLAPVQEVCDFYIREATGGWILNYAAGVEPCSCGEPDCSGTAVVYDQRVFMSEGALTDFLAEQMIQFKLWRSRKLADDTGFKPFSTNHEELPTKDKRGKR
jgi:hypothetical protein